MAGIYLHVPFCHAKCAYCDFYSVARTERVADYTEAVINEYLHRFDELADAPVTTLYFGGGTPSILPADIFRRLADTFRTDSITEFTIEVNPEDVTPNAVKAWRSSGVNRISIGVQSLIDTELIAINRRHTAEDALTAIVTIKEGGIDSISADLIYGLPEQTTESWHYSVQRLLQTGISHLSAYCLSYEPGTLLSRRLQRGDIVEAQDETIGEMYTILCKETAINGFEHYEISNFALPGCRSKHNSSYWRNVPYLGLGPGAHSLTADGTRRYNPSDLKTYILNKGLTTVTDDENETDRINDRIMIGLRTLEGLDLSRIPAPRHKEIIANAQSWLRSGHLVNRNSRLLIPESSWLLSDAIIRDLFLD